MWLDRFSANSTPSGTPPPGRSYSPAPSRRPYLSPGNIPSRPGLTPRSSSLSLLSPSSSTTSLPTAPRGPGGSQLRRQVASAAPPDVPDPLDVLEKIIGEPVQRVSSPVSEQIPEGPVQKPEEILEDIDFAGLSLSAFAQQTQAPQENSNVHRFNAQSVEGYDKERNRFEDLHRSILACDEVLKSVQAYLTNFQSDLGAVSAEIETLQSRSQALNTRLENRKVVEKLLGPAVEDISISPAMVKIISEGPIDEGFLKAIAELDKRSKTINSKTKDQGLTKALEDAKPLLTDLTNKAVERIRDHIVGQIKALRSPSINAQIIQQQAFLKYKDFYSFLAKHQPKLAEEICQAYINTMRWYYLAHFTRYRNALEKLKLHVVDKYDVIANEDTPKRSGALLSNSRIPTAPHDAFSLGRRIDLLKNPNLSALTAYVAEEDNATHYLETPFRAFNAALVDNACFEYTFLTTYFSPVQNYHAISRTFAAIFEPTFALGQAMTKQLVDTSTDALGILLAVRLNQHFAFELQRRKVPTVEGYINATNMLLWPRFQQVIDQHCESLRKAAGALPNRPPASASLLTSASVSASAASANSAAPHMITQRFANFLQGVLALSSEASDDEPVSNSLRRLLSEFQAFLTKLSKSVADQRKRDRFLYNNYSLVGTVLADTQGRLADEMKAHFEQLKQSFAE